MTRKGKATRRMIVERLFAVVAVLVVTVEARLMDTEGALYARTNTTCVFFREVLKGLECGF